MIRPDPRKQGKKTGAETSTATAAAPAKRRRVTVVTFGFKYGQPNTNHYFDVSFVKNPAREARWDLFSQPCDDMRRFVLDQSSCRAFLESAVPLIRTLVEVDDDVRIGVGCNSGRHRSCIIGEELVRRLENDHTQVRLMHREERFA